jgi:hypothetical protein
MALISLISDFDGGNGFEADGFGYGVTVFV